MKNFIKNNIIPLLVCSTILIISFFQATYFRTDLRKNMLKNGRRISVNINENKSIWLKEAPLLFDSDLDTSTPLPKIEYTQKNTKTLKPYSIAKIELALSHFPSPKNNIISIPRQPLLLEIYNGYCTTCSRELFEQKNRIAKATITINLKKLNLPILDYITSNEKTVFKTNINFEDKPGSLKIDLSNIDFFKDSIPEELQVVILVIEVLEYYKSKNEINGKTNDSNVFISEIKYYDRSFKNKNESPHLWK